MIYLKNRGDKFGVGSEEAVYINKEDLLTEVFYSYMRGKRPNKIFVDNSIMIEFLQSNLLKSITPWCTVMGIIWKSHIIPVSKRFMDTAEYDIKQVLKSDEELQREEEAIAFHSTSTGDYNP